MNPGFESSLAARGFDRHVCAKGYPKLWSSRRRQRRGKLAGEFSLSQFHLYRIGAGLICLCLILPICGCGRSARPARTAIAPSALAELGRPWPVLVNEYRKRIVPVRHDDEGFTFGIGPGGQARYRLDYKRRRVLAIPGAPEGPGYSRLGRAGLAGHNKQTLVLNWPGGRQAVVSSAAAPFAGPAQTGDLSGVAYYELTDAGARLVYYDQPSGEYETWRELAVRPARASLLWSASGRHLCEAIDGQLVVHNREFRLVVGTAAGTRPVFSGDDRYISFLRTDGRPSLLDLRTGFEWPLPSLAAGYRPLPPVVWSPDASRIFILAEKMDQAKKNAAPFLLYLYSLPDARLRSYALDATFDLKRYSILLQAAQPEVARLAGLIPRLRNGPLVALGQSGYLVGEGHDVSFLDLEARLVLLHRFDEPVRDLYLAPSGRRLIVIAGRPGRAGLYAWRLPRVLAGAFADRRDLRLGGLRLGMSKKEAIALLGKPLSAERMLDPVGGRDRIEILYYTAASLTLAGGRLSRIIYSAGDSRTGRGAGVGSTLGQVHELYGRPSHAEEGYLSYHGIVDGRPIKVAFTLDARRAVTAVLVAYDRMARGARAK